MLNEVRPPPLETDGATEKVVEEPVEVVHTVEPAERADRTYVVPHLQAPRGGYPGANYSTLNDASLRRDPTPDVSTYDAPTVMREAPSDLWLSVIVVSVVLAVLGTVLVIFI